MTNDKNYNKNKEKTNKLQLTVKLFLKGLKSKCYMYILLLKFWSRQETNNCIKGSFYHEWMDEVMSQQNKNMPTPQKKKRERNTYWGKPHHFKNPNCKTKIHKENDE